MDLSVEPWTFSATTIMYASAAEYISNHFTFPIQLIIVQSCGFDPKEVQHCAPLIALWLAICVLETTRFTGRARGHQHAVKSPRVVAKVCDTLSGKCHTAHPDSTMRLAMLFLVS